MTTEEKMERTITPITLLDKYIDGWRMHDKNAILKTLTSDGVVTESFGPVYRGHYWVERWISGWLAERGRVIDWTIQDLKSQGDMETATWTFHYVWRGEEKIFEGATIAELYKGKISNLRAYATTAPLYDWRGEWRPF